MKYSSLILLFASTSAWSEISSLTSEELTDTYIKDTTVIVRPQKSEPVSTEDVRVQLKVSPLEETTQILPQENEQTLSAINPALTTYTELSEQARLSAELSPQAPEASTTFLLPPPSDTALSEIRKAYYGNDTSKIIDLSTESFNQDVAKGFDFAGQGLPLNTLTADESSFTLRIPNLGNFNSQNFATPNGEVGVNVTPSHIEYTVNLPN